MVKVKSDDIHCEGCVERIDKALVEAGIAHKISLEEKSVEADCELSKVIELLDDLGFDAVEV
ncbi:MAG: metal-binding protein [Lachnospiraceae bacterium]|nr:metal-binding protein [Lachnospiraceae bacterium]